MVAVLEAFKAPLSPKAVPVADKKVIFCRSDRPPTLKYPEVTWRLPVEETFARSVRPVTPRFPANAAVPVEEILSVPAVLMEVEAFKISAEMVPVILSLPEFTIPVTVMTPAPSTLNLVDELTCRSIKFPLKLVGFAARKVPEAEPPTILLGPNNERDVEVDS